MPDPQVALQLLRHSSSYTKLSYSMRVKPPSLHLQALQDFDEAARLTLEQIGGLQLTDGAWRQAGLRVAVGGLGLGAPRPRQCSPARHHCLHGPAHFLH